MIVAPDSRAQIAIQAAERVGLFSAGVPWEVIPPLPPFLIAWLAKVPGVSPEIAYVILVCLAFAGSALAVFSLWQRMGATPALAVQAAVLALLAPSGWLAIFERGEIDRLLFWKLVPFVFLAVDAFRRKPRTSRVLLILSVLAAMMLTRSERWIAFDLLAFVEWLVIVALCRPWHAATGRSRLTGAGAALVFLAVGIMRLNAVREPGELAPMPAELVQGERVVGTLSLEAELSPFLKPVHELINSEMRPYESVLWLQALGASGVVAPAHGKYLRMLECVEEKDGWCLFDTATPAPAAVLVSRERFETLEPIRGIFDVEGLERYLVWAMRPEAVGYSPVGRGMEVRAEPERDELVLVRVRARDWVEYKDSFSERLAPDPVGYSVLDFEGEGRRAVPLLYIGERKILARGVRAEDVPLDDADYPRIAPEGVVDAFAFTPPPFAAGARVTIFGDRFRPGGAAVFLDGQHATLEYVSTKQINIVLPADLPAGEHKLVVDSGGPQSYPFPFDVLPPQ